MPYSKGTLFIAFAAAIVFLTQLGSYPLTEPDEGRYAEIAREMAEPGGDWLIPHLNGIPHFQKPPVFYWLMAASVKAFGPNETAVRLPVALSALGVLLLTLGIANRLFGSTAARFALVILASSPLFLVLGRTATPDMTMALWITAAIYCLTRAEENRRWRWLFFVAAGLGFLTKGPVAFLVPFAVAIGYLKNLRSFPWIRGLALAILIGISWFLVVSFRYHDLFDYFWKYELIERFASHTHGRSRPFWFFVPVLFGGFLPWSWALLHLLPQFFKERHKSIGLFVGWIAVPFVVLSLAGSKLPTYVLPLLPGLAVGLGAALASAVKAGKLQKCFPRYVRTFITFTIIVLALAPVIVDRFFLKAQTPLTFGMIAWAAIIAGGAIVWLIRSWNRPMESSIPALAGLIVLGLLPLPYHLTGWNNLLAQQASVKPLADRILAETSDSTQPPRVISCDIRASGLPFYLGQIVEITRKTADIVHTPEGSTLSLSVKTILHASAKQVAQTTSTDGRPVFVVTRTGCYEKYFAGGEWELLQTAGDFVLLRR